MSSNFPEQRGATLIVALVAVLLVVLLATRISSTYPVLFRGVENHTALQQNSSIDSTLELRAQPLQLPLPEGVLSACLLDLEWVRRLNAMVGLATCMALLLAVMLGLGVVLAIGNTVRLAIEPR